MLFRSIATTNLCEACHNTNKFTPATRPVDHSQVTGTCFSCHNNTKVAGKSGTHFATTNTCESCHVTTKWTPATRPVDHTQVTGTCVSCHTPTRLPTASKSATHMATTNACDSCHTTVGWAPATFDHSQTATTCALCHNGQHPPAVPKGTGHFITTQACEICHTTKAWSPVLTYTHISPAFVNHGTGNTPTCLTCHKQNNEKITYARPDLAPDCAACHAIKFKPDSHKKYTSPTTVLYTVVELRDCTGACHTYKDSTLTTISKNQGGPHHLATKSGW